jgi:hypothetical protein
VFEPGAFFEIADVEFDHGVLSVEGIDGDGVVVEISQGRTMSRRLWYTVSAT